MASMRRDLPLVLAMVLASSVPFVGKAFHIDDPAFLALAENVLRQPWRPYTGAAALDSEDLRVFGRLGHAPSTFEAMSHPPLGPYFIAATAFLTGGLREVPLHFAFLCFPVTAALAAYSLARRFTPFPLGATLLLVSSPIFILCSHSLMTDMPMLALSLGALAAFVTGCDTGSRPKLLCAGTLAGLAILSRYVGVSLVPLFVLYAVLGPRSLKPALTALAPAALLVALWTAENWVHHGGVHLVTALVHYTRYYGGDPFGSPGIAEKALSDLAGIGGTSAAAAAALVASFRSRSRTLRLAIAIAASAAICVAKPLALPTLGEYSSSQTWALVLCLGAGIFLVLEGARAGLSSWDGGPGARDRLFLLCWLVGILASSILVLPFGTARYMLPVLPPLTLLLVSSAGEIAPRLRAGVLALVVALSWASGLLLACADAEYAAAYRDVAASFSGGPGNARTWFTGDWGFRRYMEQAGHSYLGSNPEGPREGDLIVNPHEAGFPELPAPLSERTQLVRSIEVAGRWPLRLMSREAQAGFYSHGWGYLPFAFSTVPLERFDVYRITLPATASPATRP